jgi:DNA-binding winged helix-turn-helix (wHTH) protein/class 3 adenylate cyclase
MFLKRDQAMATVYAFGPFRLDEETEILFRGTEPTAVGQRAVALLRALVERPGAPVSKDVLIEAAWPGLVVEESNLPVQIAALRKVLGQEPGGEGWIETLPRRGYRFVGPMPTNFENNGSLALLPVAARSESSPPPESAIVRPPRADPERRQLSIMSCELICGRLDLEDMREAVRVYQNCVAEVVGSFHGSVAKHVGNTVVAYFGHPIAHENDVEQAVHAGLALCTAVATLKISAGVPLQGRVGIATGPVIIDDLIGGTQDRGVVGEAPGLAARLQMSAQPGMVAIDEATRRLVGKLFECHEIGDIDTGVDGKASAWRVLRTNSVESRFETLHETALTPFIGRGRELDMLARWRREAADRLYVIDIVGDPGIGKSRLLHEFRRTLIEDGALVLRGSCWPDSQHTSFRPFIEVVRRVFRLEASDAEADVARKFEDGLAFVGLATSENVGLLMNLIGLAPPPGSLTGLDGVLIGLRTRSLLLDLLRARSLMGPVAVLLEDLHWIDRASQELLARLIVAPDAPPLLIVTTYRTGYRPPWLGHAGTAVHMLEPLSDVDTRRIAELRLGSASADAALVRLVVDRAEGNPLFAEEIANFLIEQDLVRRSDAASVGGAPMAALPASVQSLLMARVDRLAQADKTVLQAASVIGRRFRVEVLTAATDAANIDARLSAMEALDLIHLDSASGEFAFKHALVRDALYTSLLGARRAELHLAIATEIERATTRPIEVAEVLAHHYARTGAVDKAIEFLAMAGRKSVGIYSVVEAERFLSQALTLARAHEQNGLDERGLNIMAELARVLTLQFKPREIIALVEPEMAAIETFADNRQTPVLLYFFGFALYTRCRFSDGRLVQEKAFRIAERQDDARAKAYATAGLIFLSTATRPFPLEEMRKLAATAVAAANRAEDMYLLATVHMSIGWSYFTRGLMLEAHECAQRLRRIGLERRDARSIAIGFWISAWADVMCEDYASALRHGEECISIATSQVDRMLGRVAMGTALVLTGRVAEGRDMITRVRGEAEANHWIYLFTATDGPLGVAQVLSGEVKAGMSWLHAFVRRGELVSEREPGTRNTAELAGLALAEVYISMLEGRRRMPLRMLLKNLVPLVVARIRASAEAERLLDNVMRSPFYDPNGMFRARIEFNLGRLQLVRKRPDLARPHLERAKAAASAQKAEIIGAKIDAALASL